MVAGIAWDGRDCLGWSFEMEIYIYMYIYIYWCIGVLLGIHYIFYVFNLYVIYVVFRN